jgi:hypothetical protein
VDQRIAAADVDRDGDMDYFAGNLGLNTQYKVSMNEPMAVTAKDFDMNGRLDPVCSYYVQGKSYPIYYRNLLLSQIPSLKNKFNTYDKYARATMNDIFPENSLKGAYRKECTYFESSYIENLGKGSFKIHSLPVEAQTSPVFGIVTDDFNEDGYTDALLTGNSYSSNLYTGQYDAFTGLFLEGNGKNEFTPVTSSKSGFFVHGDGKSLSSLTMKNGDRLILAAQNSDSLKAFRVSGAGSRIIKANPGDAGAFLKYDSGETGYFEFYYGSGYLSESSRTLRIPKGVISIEIVKYNGEKRKVF